ncbi:MAG: hypothetical protein BGO78_00075 [Chloroflexi bacterium 44-23]|nr:MAG: hypothetical protein BGO78_00075 [Chloroflexi bacterium 44-23]
MNFIIDPNLAYVFLIIGFVVSVLAILTPGTGIIEIAGIFALVVAGFGIISTPNNLWALILIVPFLPLILLYRSQKKKYYLILAILFLNVGAYTIFRKEEGGFSVSILVGLITFLINAPIIWIIVKRITEALDRPLDFDPIKIVGMVGEARTNIAPEGTAYVDGEEWSVRSVEKIAMGTKVKVIGKDGLTLIVEPLNVIESLEV